jgi:hypothetical protein
MDVGLVQAHLVSRNHFIHLLDVVARPFQSGVGDIKLQLHKVVLVLLESFISISFPIINIMVDATPSSVLTVGLELKHSNKLDVWCQFLHRFKVVKLALLRQRHILGHVLGIVSGYCLFSCFVLL